MDPNTRAQVAALPRLSVPELRAQYAQVFGEATPTRHRAWLVKRLAWRLQALAEGDLSARARRRAAELARDADLRLNPPAHPPAATARQAHPARPPDARRDGRLPPPGTVLTRKYKGALLQVEVLPDGFAYAGVVYRSLSAVAQAITRSHGNGFLFFRLGGPEGDP